MRNLSPITEVKAQTLVKTTDYWIPSLDPAVKHVSS